MAVDPRLDEAELVVAKVRISKMIACVSPGETMWL